MGTGGPRPDWLCAKEIYRIQGLGAARDWMSTPLIDLREMRVDPNLHSTELVQEMLHLPFDRAVYMITAEPQDFEGIDELCLYATSLTPPGGPDNSRVEVISYFKASIHNHGRWARFSAFNISYEQGAGMIDLVGVGPAFLGYDRPNDLAGITTCVWLALVRSLNNSSSYPVIVEPEPKATPPKQRRKAAKTRALKPWLDERAPRVIMLNPTKRYPEHGRGGTHATPMPHQRRGHWRTLQAERYKARRGQRVWVKPAWIGPSEWTHQGNIYRVVAPPKPDAVD